MIIFPIVPRPRSKFSIFDAYGAKVHRPGLARLQPVSAWCLRSSVNIKVCQSYGSDDSSYRYSTSPLLVPVLAHQIH